MGRTSLRTHEGNSAYSMGASVGLCPVFHPRPLGSHGGKVLTLKGRRGYSSSELRKITRGHFNATSSNRNIRVEHCVDAPAVLGLSAGPSGDGADLNEDEVGHR